MELDLELHLRLQVEASRADVERRQAATDAAHAAADVHAAEVSQQRQQVSQLQEELKNRQQELASKSGELEAAVAALEVRLQRTFSKRADAMIVSRLCGVSECADRIDQASASAFASTSASATEYL